MHNVILERSIKGYWPSVSLFLLALDEKGSIDQVTIRQRENGVLKIN